jgi:trehalose synthase-fused probable maltokinase
MIRSALHLDTLRQLKASLSGILGDFLQDKRWFGGKARRITAIEVEDALPLELPDITATMVLVRVDYEDGPAEIYNIPLLHSDRSEPSSTNNAAPLMEVRIPLADALQDTAILRGFYEAVEREAVFQGAHGDLFAYRTSAFPQIALSKDDTSPPKRVTGEQSNSSTIFGRRSILKLFRRVQTGGDNPELEVGRFLTERAHFPHVPPLGGWIEYRRGDEPPATLGVLQGFVENEGDAWEFTLKSLADYWRRALKLHRQDPELFQAVSAPNGALKLPSVALETCGDYLDRAALLGQRTAQMHRALASDSHDPAFAPEQYTESFQRNIENTLSSNAADTFGLLHSQLHALPAEVRDDAQRLLAGRNEIQSFIHDALAKPLSGLRTRIHGDYHLGQVLCTADDFVIIDFEGEPGRPIADRVLKRSALQDVAGMLRSFDYAAFAPLLNTFPGVELPESADRATLTLLSAKWNRWVSQIFLRAYLQEAGSADFLPQNPVETALLLRLHVLSKALFEISYELNNRPPWIRIPLAGILQLLDHPEGVPS